MIGLRAGGGAVVSLGAALRRAAGGGDPDVERDRCTGWGVMVAVTVLAVTGRGGLAGAVGAGLLVAAVPALRARRRLAAEREMVVAQLVPLASLLRLGAASGLSLRASLEAAGPWVEGPLGAEVLAALHRVGRGRSLIAELDGLAARWGGGAGLLLRPLLEAERSGAPLVPVLARLEDNLEAAERRRAEVAVRRLPIRLLGPLCCAVLPAFVLLAAVPLVATSLGALAAP